jgi:methionyl-tRNA formyltransferase
MENKKKIIFIGTPDFGAIILRELAKTEYKPCLVLTTPDKPVGRKQIITSPIVKTAAQDYNIPVIQPEKIIQAKDQITDLKPDLIVVAAFGQIIPNEILKIPIKGCLNVHPSLLPKYRGASPIQCAILNGDKETGVSVMLMDDKMDHGKIISSSVFEIKNQKTIYTELMKELADFGVKLLISTLPKWFSGKIQPITQDDEKATFTKVLKKSDGKINWKKSAEEIERQIRAFNPWPGSFTECQKNDYDLKTIKIWKASVQEETEAGPFGDIGKTYLASNEKIAVQTQKNFLIIEELQPEGGKRMTSEDFLKGRSDFIGTILI